VIDDLGFGKLLYKQELGNIEIGIHKSQIINSLMVSVSSFIKLALSFPEATEQPHFDKRSFRIKKKIFATLHEKEKRVVIKLSAIDQSVFCAFDNSIIYPVPGAWGKQGWTMIELKKIKAPMLKDAISVAWSSVAPRKLAEQLKQY
jgi:predicted DNA-binding protein (MmcQ/YjbR family)